jgi:hypothetical protein
MALTHKFKETVQLRVKQDPEYRKELIIEATNAFLDGDISTGKTLLRDYLNATEALPSIAHELAQDEKSIRRMVGPRGNPDIPPEGIDQPVPKPALYPIKKNPC